MNKYLITGGAGFIGSHLVDHLIEKGGDVVIIDNLSTGKIENINKAAKFYKADICNSKISQIFEKEKLEIVFHYAAQINIRESIKKPAEDVRTNIIGGINILENCRKYRVKKIIFASTGGIYGEADVIPTPENFRESPVSPYGIAKLAVEKYLDYYRRVFGLSFIALRLSNVYGPRQNSKGEAGVVAIFCDRMILGEQPFITGDGKQTRDFLYIDDAIEANFLAVEKDISGIFNIGTGKETTINDIFEKIKKITGSNCEKKYSQDVMGEQKRSCLDFSKAKREIGWSPKYSLDQGLEETVKWFKSVLKKQTKI